MRYYPAFLDLENRTVLVVGGGGVAARKAETLLESGAKVRLVAPELSPRGQGLAADPRVEIRRRGFLEEDLEGVALVISATDIEEVNREVAAAAGARGLFVNVVDVTHLCSFIVPAVVERGRLTIAVSTGGASPAVARRIREGLEEAFGQEWDTYLGLMASLRRLVLARGNPSEANREVFEALADAGLREMIAEGQWEAVSLAVSEILGQEVDLGAMDLPPKEEA